MALGATAFPGGDLRHILMHRRQVVGVFRCFRVEFSPIVTMGCPISEAGFGCPDSSVDPRRFLMLFGFLSQTGSFLPIIGGQFLVVGGFFGILNQLV